MISGTLDDDAEVTSETGIEINYQAPAQLVGIDETGGILQIKFPIISGCNVVLDHPFLKKAWGEPKLVKITSATAMKGEANVFQARFDAVGVGMSKSKYWEKVSTAITRSTDENQQEKAAS